MGTPRVLDHFQVWLLLGGDSRRECSKLRHFLLHVFQHCRESTAIEGCARSHRSGSRTEPATSTGGSSLKPEWRLVASASVRRKAGVRSTSEAPRERWCDETHLPRARPSRRSWGSYPTPAAIGCPKRGESGCHFRVGELHTSHFEVPTGPVTATFSLTHRAIWNRFATTRSLE